MVAGTGVVVKNGVDVVDSEVAPAVDGVSDGAGEPVVDRGVVVVGAGVSVSVDDGAPDVVVDLISEGVVAVVVVTSTHASMPTVTYVSDTKQ